MVCEEACLRLSFEQRRVVTVKPLSMFWKVSKVKNKVVMFLGFGGGCCNRCSLCCFVGEGEVLFGEGCCCVVVRTFVVVFAVVKLFGELVKRVLVGDVFWVLCLWWVWV